MEYKEVDSVVDSSAGAALRVVACNGDTILTGSARPTVKLWKVAEAKVTELAKLCYGAVGSNSVELTSDGNVAAVCSDDGLISLWDVRQKGRTGEMGSSISTAWKAKFMPDETRLVSGGPSGVVCFWDWRTCRQVTELGAPPSNKTSMRSRRDEDGSKRRRISGFGRGAISPVFSLGVSADGAYLGCGRGSGCISVMRLRRMEWAEDVHAHLGENTAVRSVAFDPSCRFVFSSADDHHVCRLDALRWTRRMSKERREPPLERFIAARSSVTSVSVCPDPEQPILLTTSWDGLVKFWDLRTHSLKSVLRGHSDSGLASAFEPVDGKFCVTTGADCKLVCYKATNNTEA